MKKLLIVLAAASLLVGACSSDDDSSDGGGGSGEQAGGDWCELAQRVEDLDAQLDEAQSSEEIEEVFPAFLAALEQAAEVAPEEIADDVDLTVATFTTLNDELEAVEFNVMALDEEVIEELDTPEQEAATDAIEAYNLAECGIDPEGGAGTGDDGEGEGAGGASDEWCDLAQRVEDISDELDAATSAVEGEAALSEMIDALDEATGMAPEEIAAEVERSLGSFTTLYDELEAVDFDPSALDDDVLAELASPEQEAATDAIQAYNLAECGIDPEA